MIHSHIKIPTAATPVTPAAPTVSLSTHTHSTQHATGIRASCQLGPCPDPAGSGVAGTLGAR